MEAVQANFGGGHHTKDTPRETRNRKLCRSSLLVVHPISSPISALIPIPDFIPNAISRGHSPIICPLLRCLCNQGRPGVSVKGYVTIQLCQRWMKRERRPLDSNLVSESSSICKIWVNSSVMGYVCRPMGLCCGLYR